MRTKYRFWILQPVFHYYDFWWWFYNKGVIRDELPSKNKYTNTASVSTLRLSDKIVEKEANLLNKSIHLIQFNYLKEKNSVYKPTKNNIMPYFEGHSQPCYWSFYRTKELLNNNKTGKVVEEDKLLGIITSRPLKVTINTNKTNKTNKTNNTMYVYYVDFLCVDKLWRKKGIAPQLIQTHEYNQSWNNKDICVSLFKREEEITGIVPLTIYQMYCFPLQYWAYKVNDHLEPMNQRIKMLTGDKQNIYYFYNLVEQLISTSTSASKTNAKWDITIMADISNIIKLVETGNLIIKMLLVANEIEAVYIFRKTCTFLHGKEIIALTASIHNTDSRELTRMEFIEGFKHCFQSLLDGSKDGSKYGYLLVEDISDNNSIINNISQYVAPIIKSQCAYFFYNFAYSPFQSGKCLIVN